MTKVLLLVTFVFVFFSLMEIESRKMISPSTKGSKYFSKPSLSKLRLIPTSINNKKINKLQYGKQKPFLRKTSMGISRMIRDLRFPFFTSERPKVNRQVQKTPYRSPYSTADFSNSGFRPVITPEKKPMNQQQYRPAYPLTQNSAQQHNTRNQMSTTFQQRKPKSPAQISARLIRTTRGPLRLPGKDMMNNRPSLGRITIPERRENFKQHAAASVPVPSLHLDQRLNKFPSNGKNTESIPKQQPSRTRARVIDVYHHIPMSDKPLQTPQLGMQNPPEIETLLKEMEIPPSSFPSLSKPEKIPGLRDLDPKLLPDLDFLDTEILKTHLVETAPPNANVYTRQPINLPLRTSTVSPFQVKPDYQSTNDRENLYVPELLHEEKSETQSIPKTQIKPNSHDIDLSESIVSSEKLAPVNDKLKYIRVSNETLSEGPLTVKKYFDFHQENADQVPFAQNQQSLQKLVHGVSKPGHEHDFKNHRMQEHPVIDPISSVIKTLNEYNEKITQVKPEQELYYNPPHHNLNNYKETIQSESITPSSSILSSEVSSNDPVNKNSKVTKSEFHDFRNQNTRISTEVSDNRTTSNSFNRITPDIESYLSTSDADRNSQSNTNTQYHHLHLPHEWDQNMAYIISDIFRRNSSTLLNENFTPETQEKPITSPGIYARNRGQFEKYEDLSNSELQDLHGEEGEYEIKQYFRGPQHVHHNNWTILEEYPIPGSRLITSTLIPPGKPWVITPPINRPLEFVTESSRQKERSDSHNKVTNAWNFANKVFGRRNHTTRMRVISTTVAPEHKKHKFAYAPLQRNVTDGKQKSESKNGGVKLVFNFRTGAAQNPGVESKSEDIKSDSKPVANQDNEKEITFKPKFQVTIPDRMKNHEVRLRIPPKDSETRNVYLNLKPATKPYLLSTTQNPPSSTKQVNDNKSHGIGIIFENKSKTLPQHIFIKSTQLPRITTQKVKQYEPATVKTSTFTYINPIKTSGYETEAVKEFGKMEATTISSIKAVTHNNYVTPAENIIPPHRSETVKKPIQIISSTTPETADTNIAQSLSNEQILVDSLRSMKLKVQEMMSKGIRHLMPLVMELFSDVSISSDCTFSLLRWLRGIKSMEQWAIKMIDASSKIPEGILYGTLSTFGSYDECIAIKTPKSNMQVSYTGQYCSINVEPVLPENDRRFTIQKAFRKYPKLRNAFQEINIDEETMAYYYIMHHRLGFCLPSTCDIDDISNVTESMAKRLMMKISVGHCETSERPGLTTGQIISMFGVIVAFGVVILATFMDFFIQVRFEHEMDIDEIVRKKNSVRQFAYAFSAYRNSCRILNTSIPMNHLSSLHGIKFLSLTWIMLGHVYYCLDYLTLAGLHKARDLGSNFAFQVVLNSAFASDTFFFLSGLLVVYSTFQYLESNDGHFTIVGFYIRRYCRLTPAFIMISGVILLGPLVGSGPIWNETMEPFVTGCQNYWWTNIFYFSNFVPTAKACVPHGWFLSCDMQFFIISPIIILALYRRPKVGLLLIGLGIVISMLATGFLTFMYNLPPVSLFTLPHSNDINDYLDNMGYKPYAHYAPYCIGMATGFLLAVKEKISISKCIQMFGWGFVTTTCMLVIYGTWKWNSGNLPDWPVSVAYATSCRTVWALGIAWLVVTCYSGCGGAINDVLSWKGFVPLSRLSYLAYLIHPLLMYVYASYVRAPFYFSQYVVVYLYLGHICVTFGLAFIFSLAFELPFLNLEKLVTKRLDQNKRKRRASFTHFHFNWQHPEHPELKDSVVLMRRRTDRFLT